MTRRTSAETAARFRASYERRARTADADPVRRRLGAIVAACRAAGRPVPVWVRVQLFGRRSV